MFDILQKIDTHIHTEATAPYKKGDSHLKPYHEAGAHRNLELMCITDHFHYITQDPKYIRLQRAHIDQEHYTGPKILLGVEQTILNDKGKLAIRDSTIPLLDMINISIHWFGMGVPGFIGGTRLSRSHMKVVNGLLVRNQPKGRRFLEYYANTYSNALTNPKIKRIPKIIGHPWSNFLENGMLYDDVLTHIGNNIKVLAEVGGAFEFNETVCANLLTSISKETATGESQSLDFLIKMAGLLNDHGVWITVSSDAHQLERIGDTDAAITLLKLLGGKTSIKNLRAVNEEFFAK